MANFAPRAADEVAGTSAQALPQRLVLFSLEPLGQYGGMDVYDESLHKALAQDDSLDLVWVTSDAHNTSTSVVETWRPFRDVFGTGQLALQGLRYLRGLSAVVRRAAAILPGPVAIHQQYVLVPPLELIAMTAAQRLGIPWIITPHEALPYEGAGTIKRWIRRKLLARADGIVALSAAGRKDLAALTDLPSDRIFHAPLGHLNDHPGVSLGVDQAAARQRLNIDPSAPVLLFFGEMRPIKGLDHLLRAMPLVLGEVPDAVLLIAGRPHRIKPDVFLEEIGRLNIGPAVRARWEFVPNDELAYFMMAADVVVLPYLAASQSAACFTAYAFNRAVVASDVGGLADQVVHEHTGLLVPPGDSPALASALVRLLRNREEARRLGEQANAWALRQRSWEAVAREMVTLYWNTWNRRRTKSP